VISHGPSGIPHTNLESQRRQYDLVRDARTYGLRTIEVIDDDFGTTASDTAVRPGFQNLVGLVCAGTVSAVFSVEASRLTRVTRELERPRVTVMETRAELARTHRAAVATGGHFVTAGTRIAWSALRGWLDGWRKITDCSAHWK
jgi:hypothetical protein